MKGKFVLVLCLMAVVLLVVPGAAVAKTKVPVTFTSSLTPTNQVVVTGSATLKIQMRPLRVRVYLIVKGLESCRPHPAAICGFTDGRPGRVPGLDADTNLDGLISGPEARAVTGNPLAWLAPFKKSKHKKAAWVSETVIGGDDLTALNPLGTPLSRRVIVVSGVTLMPTYTVPFWDPDAPAACGAIKSVKDK